MPVTFVKWTITATIIPVSQILQKKFRQESVSSGWWIYLFILALLLLPSLLNVFSARKEITWQQFEKDILSRKAVEKIVVINNEKAEVYI